MENFILYLIKASLCLTVFGILFRLLLLKDTFFRFTRFVLLTGMVVCSVLPLITIKIKVPFQASFLLEEYLFEHREFKSEWQQSETQNNRYSPITSIGQPLQTFKNSQKNNSFNWFDMLTLIYWSGIGLMLIRLTVSFLRLNRLITTNKIINHNGFKLVICNNDIAPFSFFRYVIISENDYAYNSQEIILHEQIHINKRHNIDLILTELLLVFHWFNPVVWMLGRDLREIHEYETDHAVIESGISAQHYQLLLIRKAVGEKKFSAVINSFNQSKLKNRITMMLKTKSTPWARLKALFIVPVVVFTLFIFAKNETIDHLERKEIATYFMQLKEAEKENNITAYFYLNQNKQLFMMSGNDSENMIKSFDMNTDSDLSDSLVEVINQHMRNNPSKVLKMIIGANEETKMESVSILKEDLSKAFQQWKGTIPENDKALYDLSQLLTLSLKYVSYPYQKEFSTAKQIGENPFYYWDTFHKYCSENGIDAKRINQMLKSENESVIPVLINNLNQVKIRNYTITNPNEIIAESNINAVKSIIINEWEKRNEGLITKSKPLFFALQHDISTNTDAVIQTVKVLLPIAYDDAIKEIADRELIDIQNIQKQMQLLLLNSGYSITAPPPPPPPPPPPSSPSSIKKAENKISEREKLIKAGSKTFSFHSVTDITKENRFVFYDVVDNLFPKGFQSILDIRKKRYSTATLNNLAVTLNNDITIEEIRMINQTIKETLTVNNLIFFPMISK